MTQVVTISIDREEAVTLECACMVLAERALDESRSLSGGKAAASRKIADDAMSLALRLKAVLKNFKEERP